MPLPAVEASRKRLRVAVIGAGAAGLVTARELIREGHQVIVFEKGAQVGGIWLYSADTETDDELGLDQGRKRIHSSLYSELRTNLPRELMGFSDFPFTMEALGAYSVDPRRFCRHEEVWRYLNLFALEYDLHRRVRLNTVVDKAIPLPLQEGQIGHQWQVTSTALHSDEPTTQAAHTQTTEVFDAVVSAVGNYHEPNLPDVSGIRSFPGVQVHCHNYRTKHRFTGLRVLVVGASFSGDEIARQIASVATEVVHCARTWVSAAGVGKPENLSRSVMVTQLTADGRAIFQGGHEWRPEAIVYCTGYRYAYPWLPAGVVDIEEGRVSHLYNHIFPPQHAPTLAFVGLIVRSVRFFQFEMQGRYIARCLSGRVKPPSKSSMWDDIATYYARVQGAGVPMRYVHSQGKGHSPDSMWEYNDKLARLCGPDVVLSEPWRIALSALSFNFIFNRPDSFRDQWTAEEVEAYEVAAMESKKLLFKHRIGKLPNARL